MRLFEEIKEKSHMMRRAASLIKKRKINNTHKLYWAFLLDGSLGDYIVLLKIVEVINEACPNNEVDIFVPKNKLVFAKTVFWGYKGIHGYYPNRFHERYAKYYDFAIKTTHYSEVKYIAHNRVKKISSLLYEKLIYLKKSESYFSCGVEKDYYNFMMRCKFWGLTRYDAIGNGGILPTGNSFVKIFLDDKYKYDFYKWNSGKKYITTNYGIDMVRIKLWPKEYLEQLLAMIKFHRPDIEIVQLGGSNAPKLNNVDKYLFGKSFEFAKYVLKNSMLHIDCEGGLVHLASQLGTKCVVVAGPTPIWYYGYKRNINIVATKCKDCAGVVPYWYERCMKGYEHPICMYSIKPQYVFDRIKKEIMQQE